MNVSANDFSDPARLDLDNACLPEPGLMVGGCPSDRDLARLKRAGFKTVLDLRESKEWSGDDFAGRVKQAGLRFLQLPVSGLESVDESLTRQFWAYWNDARLKPMLVHCASGNRVGAMLALAARRHGKVDVEQAIDSGLAAGMKAAEPIIRKTLGQSG
ncbi:MAG: hypothetical protein EA418_09785 [Wenzhouxiangellaceae bacterium]|nr:MAG: hypothetical protein EA418_09785 [Wenzhouxiangellaceae bacterium]